MPTQTPLTDAINALTTYANTVTGASDTDLSSAVATLASGYGGGGSDDRIYKMFMNTLTDFTDSDLTAPVKGLLSGNTVLETVSMPNAVSLPNDFLRGCTHLTTVSFPSLASIPYRAFNNCSALTTMTFSELASSGDGGGGGHVTIGQQAFDGCSSITSINKPKAIPNSSAFSGCTNLVTAVLKGNYLYGSSTFNNCSSLTGVDLQIAPKRLDNAFKNCTVLNTLILRGTTVAPLNNTSSFDGTPFANGGTGGHIYIPKSLYDQLGTGTNDYKATTNWSTIDGYGTITWHQIEGSTYETHYVDGTSIS